MKLNKIWQLFKTSFPEHERRSYEMQQKLLLKENYNIKIYETNSLELEGFIAYWEFEKFIFIEHLAVSEKLRGRGLGQKIINEMKNNKKPLILEVELPDMKDINTLRRIEFYERQDFKLCNYDYYQPPLNKTDEKTPMKIMVYNDILNNEKFYDIRNILYKEVYEI